MACEEDSENLNTAITSPEKISQELTKTKLQDGLEQQCFSHPDRQCLTSIVMEYIQEIDSSYLRDEALRKFAGMQLDANHITDALSSTEVIEKSSTRAHVLIDIASAQAKALQNQAAMGSFAKAVDAAKQITDMEHRANFFKEIATAQSEIGFKDAASNSFKIAAESAWAIEIKDRRIESLLDISEKIAQAGRYSEAIEIAHEVIENEEKSIFTLDTLAQLQTAAGLTVDALTTVDTFDEKSVIDVEFKLLAAIIRLSEIAVAQAVAGKDKEATNTFETCIELAKPIENPTQRSFFLLFVVKSQAEIGRIDDALSTFNEIRTQNSNRFSALMYIAVAQAKSGDPGSANQIFQRAFEEVMVIENVGIRIDILLLIAGSQIEAGLLDTDARALQAAVNEVDKIKNSNDIIDYIDIFDDIARVQIQASRFNDALITARKINNLHHREHTLDSILYAQIHANLFTDARVTAQEFDELGKAYALSYIAAGEIMSGQIDAGIFTLRDALNLVNTIDDSSEELNFLFRKIAITFAKADKIKEAVDISRKIREAHIRALALAQIASKMQ